MCHVCLTMDHHRLMALPAAASSAGPLRQRHESHNWRRIKRVGLGWVAATLSVLSTTAAWASYSCTGTVNDMNVSPGTGVVIFSSSAGLGSVYLCLLEGSTSSANGTVTPEQCKAMLTLLMAAQLSGQSVVLSFNDSLTCTTHPSWAWLTGWYWGPALQSN